MGIFPLKRLVYAIQRAGQCFDSYFKPTPFPLPQKTWEGNIRGGQAPWAPAKSQRDDSNNSPAFQGWAVRWRVFGVAGRSPINNFPLTGLCGRGIGGGFLAFVLLFFLSASSSFALTLSGQEYLPLRSTAAKLGLRTAISVNGKEMALSGASQSVRVTLNQRSSTINGTCVWLNYPIAENKDKFFLSRLDYQRTLVPLLRPNAFALNRYHLRHIVLDAGHGGHDTGARNTRLKAKEKTLTLDITNRVKQRLEALGYRVTLTRDEDRFVELKDRSRVANALRADLFVSIHLNASTDKSITGVETYAYTPQGAPSSSRDELNGSDKTYQSANAHDIANLWLAYETQRALVSDLKASDRGVRRARFAVLENLRCPGILVEGGFISSPSEGSRLCSTLYRQQLANAIVDGIRGYHRRIMGMK